MNYSLPVLEYNCEGSIRMGGNHLLKTICTMKGGVPQKRPNSKFTDLKNFSKNFISNKILTNKEGELCLSLSFGT